jgi:hypothetical protein
MRLQNCSKRLPLAQQSANPEEDEILDRQMLEFFNPATHVASMPSRRSRRSETTVVMDSNEGIPRGSEIHANTQGLVLLPRTDPSTSMAAEAMISLGAAPGNAYIPAAGSAPVISVAATSAHEGPAQAQAEAVSVVVRPETDANTNAPPKTDMLAVRREKLAQMKAQLAEEAKNQPQGATVRRDKLAQQAKNEPPQAMVVESVAPHWAKGQVMCFMLPKPGVVPAKLINVYGILAKDILAELLQRAMN